MWLSVWFVNLEPIVAGIVYMRLGHICPQSLLLLFANYVDEGGCVTHEAGCMWESYLFLATM